MNKKIGIIMVLSIIIGVLIGGMAETLFNNNGNEIWSDNQKELDVVKSNFDYQLNSAKIIGITEIDELNGDYNKEWNNTMFIAYVDINYNVITGVNDPLEIVNRKIFTFDKSLLIDEPGFDAALENAVYSYFKGVVSEPKSYYLNDKSHPYSGVEYVYDSSSGSWKKQ